MRHIIWVGDNEGNTWVVEPYYTYTYRKDGAVVVLGIKELTYDLERATLKGKREVLEEALEVTERLRKMHEGTSVGIGIEQVKNVLMQIKHKLK